MGETLWTSVSIDYNKNVKLARNLKFLLLTTPFSEQRKLQGEKQQWEAHIWKCVVYVNNAYYILLSAALNSICQTPVSASTVKRWLQDTGLPSKVAKKKPQTCQ